MCFCRGQYLLWGVIAILAVMSMLSGCGAKGDLYLPEQSEQQKAK